MWVVKEKVEHFGQIKTFNLHPLPFQDLKNIRPTQFS